MSDSISKSWFTVFPNPEEHGLSGTPEEICNTIMHMWCDGSDSRSCAVLYCISADGLPHLHCVFEDSKAMRFPVIKKCFPSMHIEETKGNKQQVEDYINKRGVFEEKGEKILAKVTHGEIKGCQGKRTDIDEIDKMIQQGLTPNEIMDTRFSYRKYEKSIKAAYYRKRYLETPIKRDILSYWHIGESGSGKTYTYVKLCEEYGEDNVYLVTDYSDPFGNYNGERIVFFDEFRGQVSFSTLLNTYLSPYRVQVHCRYSNCYALWNEVHFATVFTPELCYQKMVSENQDIDSLNQLNRRISLMVFHSVDNNGNYHKFELPMCEYTNYEDLKTKALKAADGQSSFDDLLKNTPQEKLKFD